MLADENQGVGQDIEGDGETSTGNTHHELVLFEFVAPIFVYAHRGILAGRMFEFGDAGLVVAKDTKNFVEFAVDGVEANVHASL